MRIKQAIQIGNHIDDIFKLPCVFSVWKSSKGIEYLFGDTKAERHKLGEFIVASKGDWLCEDYECHWHLLSDDEYTSYLSNH